MSQINPKEFVHTTAYSVQLPYIAGLSFNIKDQAYLNARFTKVPFKQWTKRKIAVFYLKKHDSVNFLF